MRIDEQIYEEFLVEMQALEGFRSKHSKLQKGTPLEQLEDPDTKRIVEALAFFSARSRMHGVHTLTQTHERLFRQYFPYLLNRLPSMGLIQFLPSLRMTEIAHIPEGTELIFKRNDDKEVFFRTIEPVDLYPLFYDHFESVEDKSNRKTLLLHFDALHPNLEEVQILNLYISHLKNFSSGTYVLALLQQTVESIFVYYDGNEQEKMPAEMLPSNRKNRELFSHPVDAVRLKLHLPEQELFFKIGIPAAKQKWKSMTLCLELSRHWPKSLTLTKESFALNVTPIINIKKREADPIRCDGTKDHYPVLYPDPKDQCKLHQVNQVSKIEASGTSPLAPAILGIRENAYEADLAKDCVSLSISDALLNPATVIVDAFWTQPWFSDDIDCEFKAYFSKEPKPGIGLSPVGNFVPEQRSLLDVDPHMLLRILALKNQSRLDFNEMMLLCNCLKQMDTSRFAMVPELIQNVTIDQQIDQLGVSLSMEYTFELKAVDEIMGITLLTFFRYLHIFLNCWLSNFHVQTKIVFSNRQKSFVIKGGSEDEFSILARNFVLP